jgi:hypothetical protein
MRRFRLLGPIVAIALTATACGNSTSPSPSSAPSTGPTASPSAPTPLPTTPRDPAEIYAEINAEVQAIRGLEASEPIEPQLVDSAEMSDILERSVREDSPPELLAAYERLYKGMDLIDAGASLPDLFVDLLSSQVAGLYDPETSSLYVVSKEGTVGPVEQVFYAHEFDHALQDQQFDLQQLQENLTDQTDRQLARQALVEGDAYTLMSLWLVQNLTPAEMSEILAAGSDPETLAALERIPPIIKEQILFAALTGTQWVQQMYLSGGWDAVNEAFAEPPDSTEQILHADKWESREPPVEVTIDDGVAADMGAGWTEGLQDTFGEHQLGIWLGPEGVNAAVGWGGDRVVLLDGPDDAWAIALVTEWDTPADATEFADAAVARLDSAGVDGDVSHQPGQTRVTVLFASDAEAATGLDRIFGNTGV